MRPAAPCAATAALHALDLHASRHARCNPLTLHAPPTHTHNKHNTRTLYSKSPYTLRREAAACLLTLVLNSKTNVKKVITHEELDEGGGEPESLARLLWAKLLRTCGDYPMQVRRDECLASIECMK